MIDSQLEFSSYQAITATAVSTNILDLGKREIAFGTPVPLMIQIMEDFNNLTSLKVAVETAETSDMSGAIELASATVAAANLKAGKILPLNFMPAGNKGYVQLKYTVTGTAPTIGKISAHIVDGIPQSYHDV